MSDEWNTDEPPLGVEIEYFRDNGTQERAVVEKSGKFGIGPSGKAPSMRQQYKKVGAEGIEMFEIKRWRYVDKG